MPEITTNSISTGAGKKWVVLAAVFACVASAYFFGLSMPLVGPDEPRYAQVAREMFDRGDWVTPTLGGANWFEKPALLYWLEIAAYRLFGVSEFAARLGPALFGLGTIVSLWLLGRFAAKYDSAVSAENPAGSFANWLALIAVSTLGIIVFSHGASFDIIITFPMTASLVSFYIYDRAAANASLSADRPRVAAPLILFYLFIGVALLAKGLIGILFPFAIVAFYYVLSWKMPSRMFVLSLVWGTALAIAVAAVWYLPMYMRHGYAFIDEFIIQHHFQRFTSNKYQHPQPFYFFLWVLPLMTLPWLPFLVMAIWKFGAERLQRLKTVSLTVSKASPLLIFSAAWVAVPLVFFSLSGSKLPGYILPAVPGAVVFVSVYLYGLVEKSRNWRIAIGSIAAVTLVSTAVAAVYIVPSFVRSDTVKDLIGAADQRGYTRERVLSMHTTSHNAEFYAAGRLARDETGKQLRLYGVDEVINQIKIDQGYPVLVLIPTGWMPQITQDEKITNEVIANNGELTIVRVALK